ncbi:MAG: alpha/beta hydrolase [Nevskia sp.]|nr:alpha/beta hydrolase [Nevskia sp.]
MDPEKMVVNVPGGFNVYVERHRFDSSFETVILVNGALATTTSFSQTVKYLKEHFNVILYDLPYAGQSKQHNDLNTFLTKDDEVQILSYLIDRFAPEYLMSISWGGVAGLLALARQPKSIKKAIIGSFSPVLNKPMMDYISRAEALLEAQDQLGAADLLNSTVGKYLPRLLKVYNHRYLTSLPVSDCAQVAFHIRQVISLDASSYIEKLASIKIPVLFGNGQLDEYTTGSDVRMMARFIDDCSFVTLENTGHFLDLESKRSWNEARRVAFNFLLDGAESRKHHEHLLAGTAGSFEPSFAAAS